MRAPFPEVLDRTERALAAEGFGIVTRIDMRATLKEKIGAEIPPYVVLGACNPKLAHRAIGIEPRVGLVLPCNVVVYRREDTTHVASVDPERMLSIVDNTELAPIAADVKARLTTVVERATAG